MRGWEMHVEPSPVVLLLHQDADALANGLNLHPGALHRLPQVLRAPAHIGPHQRMLGFVDPLHPPIIVGGANRPPQGIPRHPQHEGGRALTDTDPTSNTTPKGGAWWTPRRGRDTPEAVGLTVGCAVWRWWAVTRRAGGVRSVIGRSCGGRRWVWFPLHNDQLKTVGTLELEVQLTEIHVALSKRESDVGHGCKLI